MFEEENDEIEVEHCRFCYELIAECQCGPPPKCPFCGDEAESGGVISLEEFDCEHFIAGWDDGGFQKSLLNRINIPVGAEKLKGRQWSSKKLKIIFEEVEPLLALYNGDFTDQPDEEEFVEILLEMMPEIEQQDYYYQHPASMLGWQAVMYFTKNPDATRKRIAALMGKLQKGFESLEDSTCNR